jgi:hypothetical protein
MPAMYVHMYTWHCFSGVLKYFCQHSCYFALEFVLFHCSLCVSQKSIFEENCFAFPRACLREQYEEVWQRAFGQSVVGQSAVRQNVVGQSAVGLNAVG